MSDTNSALASLAARPQATQDMATVADLMRARAMQPYQQAQMQAQTGVAQQQQQELALKNQQTQAELAANQKFGQLWASSGGDMGKLHSSMQEAAQNDPNFAQFVPQHIQALNQYQQSLYTLGDAEAKNLDTKNDEVLPSLNALSKADPKDRPALRDQLVQKMEQAPNLFPPQEIQAVQNMPLDDQTIQQNLAAHNSQKQILTERDTAARELTAKSSELKDRYENVNGVLYDKGADGGPKPLLSAGMGTTDLRSAIDKIAPPDNALTKDLNNAAQVQVQTFLGQGNLKAANDAVTELTKAVAARSEKVNPAIMAAHSQEVADAAKLTEQLRTQITSAIANDKDARDRIESTVLKPYQEKMSSIGELQSAMDQAQSGNIAAARASLYKLIGVSQPQGAHRVMPAEVEGFSGMGSLSQRMKGSIANALSGDPWTPKMVEDIKSFSNAQGKNAQDNLTRGIQDTNKLYGTKVGQGLLGGGSNSAPASGGATAPKAGMIRARDASGKLHEAPEGTALPKNWTLETKK
jgi:hypothetical protein